MSASPFTIPRKQTYLLISALILVVSPLKILAIPAVVIYLAFSLPRVNIFSRFVISLAIFFALNTVFGGVAYVLDIALPVEVLLLLHLFVITLIRLALPIMKEKREGSTSNLSTIFVLVVFGSIFLATTLPVLRTEGYGIYKKVTFGGDNTSHIELIKAVVDRGGYFYEKPINTGYAITENLAGYPQGLHYNAYVLIESAKPLIDVTKSFKRILIFYYIYTLLIYLAFAALYVSIISIIFSKKVTVGVSVAVTSAGILFSGILFSLFALGFHTQVASLALLLAMLTLLYLAAEESNSILSKAYFILALIVLAGISFTWLFLLPVAGLIVLAHWFAENGLRTFSMLKNNSKYLSLCAALLSISLIQPLVQLLNQTTKTSGVNEIGFTVIPNTLIVTSLVAISLAFIPTVFKKSRLLWFSTIGIAAFFSLYVYVYQWSRVGESRYYFHKSLFTLIVLSSIIVVVLIGNYIDYLVRTEPRHKRVVLFSILFAGALLTTYNLTNRNDYFQKQEGGGFSVELAATIGRLIEESPENGRKIITVGSCNRAHDYTASRLAGTLTGDHDIWRQSLISALLAPDRVTLFKSIKKYQEVRSPELIIISTDYGLQKQLETELDDGYGKETYIDLDFGHIPKSETSCPHHVR